MKTAKRGVHIKYRVEYFECYIEERDRIEYCARLVSVRGGKERWRQSETNVKLRHVKETASDVLQLWNRLDVEVVDLTGKHTRAEIKALRDAKR